MPSPIVTLIVIFGTIVLLIYVLVGVTWPFWIWLIG